MQTTTTAASFETILGCDAGKVGARLNFLGLFVTCSRCHGSGNYSFNLQDGSRCYGCNGRGKRAPKFSAKLGAKVAEMVAAGALEPFFAKVAENKAARIATAGLIAQAREIYMVIGNAYEVAYRAHNASWNSETGDYMVELPLAISNAQGMNNSLFFGDHIRENDSVCSIESRVKAGKLGAVRAVAMLNERIDELTALRTAYGL